MAISENKTAFVFPPILDLDPDWRDEDTRFFLLAFVRVSQNSPKNRIYNRRVLVDRFFKLDEDAMEAFVRNMNDNYTFTHFLDAGVPTEVAHMTDAYALSIADMIMAFDPEFLVMNFHSYFEDDRDDNIDDDIDDGQED